MQSLGSSELGFFNPRSQVIHDKIQLAESNFDVIYGKIGFIGLIPIFKYILKNVNSMFPNSNFT